MNLRKTIPKSCVNMMILTSLLTSIGCVSTQNHKEIEEVQVAKIGYNEGKIVSHWFDRCSAVIFDYNNEAIMAHSLPHVEPELDDSYITLDNVVEKMIMQAKNRKFDLNNTEIYVCAGNQESLDIIRKGLSDRGLEPKVQQLNHEENKRLGLRYSSKTINYDPAINQLNTSNSNY